MKHIMAGATIIDPDINDSQGSMTVTLQELTFPIYGTVQHPALALKSVMYCIHVELALEQSILAEFITGQESTSSLIKRMLLE